MGASSSTAQNASEQRELESLVASTGALPMLQHTFSKISDPQSNTIPSQSLQECFNMDYKTPDFEAHGSNNNSMSDSFCLLVDNLGESIVQLFFVVDKGGGVSWIELLRGYLNCCGRVPASVALNVLLKLFCTTCAKAGLPLKLEFEPMNDDDGKIGGFVLATDVVMLLWICWTMLWDSKTCTSLEGRGNLCLPDVSHLVLSAVVYCVEDSGGFDLWDCDISALDVQIPAGKFVTWALTTVPCLTDCFTQFVNARLQNSAYPERNWEPSTSSVGEILPKETGDSHLLTCGRAWAISLTLRGTPSTEILKLYLPSGDSEACDNLLYRSSLHGRGLNRFWSNIEGYNGPMLLLFCATSRDAHEVDTIDRKWIIGALTQQGFENKDLFYGSSGNLYAISPVFNIFPASGKEKNFVYSHLHPTGRMYEAHPKPEGIAFGGTMGNERIFIDEDFAKITVRHHAADKTYKHGSLFPSQGFLAVEALILEVEVWGLGGKTPKSVQTSYKKREELFIDQRRKIDLKTFTNWEDSPEKMMMDMMSNPNAARREER
ncbi:uncharacterized protein LOC126687377 isoform X2 [Mercurialis annua]|uniref:uncharacterized protein LOC126687377 isoform X2 n=1 Tax=Mercurialis annua TaxID=3986 RepID=UPI00215F33D3|nr:uncharacterized protein LOC126687377 isoform X2 [Mercurialis annua]